MSRRGGNVGLCAGVSIELGLDTSLDANEWELNENANCFLLGTI